MIFSIRIDLLRFYLLVISFGVLSVPAQSQTSRLATYNPYAIPSNVDSMERFTANIKDKKVKLDHLILLEFIYSSARTDKLGTYLPVIKQLSEELHDQPGLGAYFRLSGYKKLLETDYKTALDDELKSLRLSRACGDTLGEIRSLFVIVTIHQQQNGVVFPLINSKALVENSLRDIHTRLEQIQNPYFNLRLKIAEGTFLRTQEKYREAIKKYREGIVLAQKLPDAALYLSYMYNDLGSLLIAVADYRGAIAIFLSTLKTAKVPVQATVYYNLGRAYTALSEYDKAIQALRTGEQIIQTNKLDVFALRYTEAWENLYAQKGDYKTALIYADSLKKKSANLLKKQSLKQVADMQIQYETRQKEQENRTLQAEKQVLKNQQKFLFLFFLVAAVAIVIISLLALRLFKNRQRLLLTNQHLEEAFREIKQLNNMQSYYYGIIAHDLRSPLHSFQKLAQVITYLGQTGQFYQIESVASQVQVIGVGLEHILDNLLNWGPSQREQLPYKPQLVNIQEVLTATLGVYQVVAKQKQIQLQANIPATIMVWADPNGLLLIIRNLLDNALKHTPEMGNVHLQVTHSAAEPVMITITNSGKAPIPIDMVNLLQKIFDGHHQGNIGEEGLGMGLILANTFCHRNRGKLRVTSTEDGITTFTCLLPTSLS